MQIFWERHTLAVAGIKISCNEACRVTTVFETLCDRKRTDGDASDGAWKGV